MALFSIDQQVEDLIEAAIARDVTGTPAPMGEALMGYGTFYTYNGATGSRVVVPGRDGLPPGFSPGPNDSVADPATYQVGGTTAAAIYSKWEDRIYSMFYPFKTMPQPADFQSSADRLEPVLKRLAIEPATFPKVESGNPEYLGFKVEGNDVFTLVGSAATEFALFQGLTSDAFRKYYLDRFALVTQRQYAVAQMILASVVGEQEVWRRLEEDVQTLLHDATAAFQDGGGVEIPFAVIGALLGIASVIPALSAVAGPTGTVARSLSVLVPQGTEEKRTYHLKGHSADELWSSLQDLVANLKHDAASPERDLGDKMSEIGSLMIGRPADFDLGQIDDDGDGTSIGDEFDTTTDASGVIGDRGVLYVDPQIMVQTGADLITVSHEFDRAAADLGTVLQSGPWSRGAGIGSGFLGHYEQTAALADALVTILRNTAQGLSRAGEVVQIAARRIDGTDGAVDADLTRHRREVERAERAEAAAAPS